MIISIRITTTSTTCFGLCIGHHQVVHFLIMKQTVQYTYNIFVFVDNNKNIVLYSLLYNKKVYNLMMVDKEAETCSC
jgi:hypothetical protein